MGEEKDISLKKEKTESMGYEISKIILGFITGLFILFPPGMSAAYILTASKSASEQSMYLGITALVLIIASIAFSILAIQLANRETAEVKV
ncbi:MAG: hypothetical protein QXT63_09745 [Thermoplasmata archaeon]